jgi:hypothetical protein
MNDLPKLDLAYGVLPPATVYVTLDPDAPVQNTLTFNVMNASTDPIGFNNPEGLTPSSDLPAYGDSTPNALDRPDVWFPWGTDAGDLATPGGATAIVASTKAADWAQPVQMSDPTLGVYWIRCPTD